MTFGYIYIRTNEYWDLYDSCKLGITSSILDREQLYVTCEIKRGSYIMIIQVEQANLKLIERKLQMYFNSLGLHVKFDGGIEFYKKSIGNYIIPYLISNNIEHKILSPEEIKSLDRKIRICNNNSLNLPIDLTIENNNMQKNLINNSDESLINNSNENLIDNLINNLNENMDDNLINNSDESLINNSNENLIDDLIDDLDENSINNLDENLIDDLDENLIDDLDENSINNLDKNLIDDLIDDLDENLNGVESENLNDIKNEDLDKNLYVTDDIIRDIIENLNIVTYEPREYQKNIIDKSNEYFKNNSKGILILPCGIGKTLISLWVGKAMGSNTIVIGVPNILLLKQWIEKICELFENYPYLVVLNGVGIEQITNFLETNKNRCIVITTYASAYKITTSIKQIKFTFDMKILDEVHHLTASNANFTPEEKIYVQMLSIQSIKQLSLTATLKQLENDDYDENSVISNDNIEFFGEIIDRRCLLWAIEQNIICDYLIQTIFANSIELEEQLIKFSIETDNNKRMFLSAYASLKSIQEKKSHHLLIYSNSKENSIKLIEYIRLFLSNNYFDIPELFYSNYHSGIKLSEQKKIIEQFTKSKIGIITNVYCLSEGWDFPLLDGVVFSENMSSNIRIVQSALRACRKNKDEPDKIAKIILPILNKDDFLENNDNLDLKKVTEVIYQMSLEDSTIIQKIKICNINILNQNQHYNQNQELLIESDELNECYNKLIEKLELSTIPRNKIGLTYEKAKKIIREKNIKSKKDYFELCERDYRFSREPEQKYLNEFTNWIDYLSIERIYWDFETCKNKIDEYLSFNPEIRKNIDLSFVCEKLCEFDSMFPPKELWIDYYNIKDLDEIIVIINRKKKNQKKYE